MTKEFSPKQNYQQSRKSIGYKTRKQTQQQDYTKLGFKSGLEIHQQLKTDQKLFCNCPAGIYQNLEEYDAEIIRHMRPTLSELGEYDGTALMEFKTRKNITYRIKNETACTYDIDDTPPFPLNRHALKIAMEIAMALKTSIVGELHITRKQYLDGSIPTGFQRTAIVGIEGQIRLKTKPVRIIQLSIEEDSCREVSDIGHNRVYTTDRLGIPLIEVVTYPDMLHPEEVAEAANYIRFLTRSTGKVRTGIGAGREDVNVSIKGGTRVEIKGVAHIKWIPELTHNEAFRQRSFLEIKKILSERVAKPGKWKPVSKILSSRHIKGQQFYHQLTEEFGYRIAALNLPDFKGILSFFTQPDKCFANELSDRLKVIACLEKPNMRHSEEIQEKDNPFDFDMIRNILDAEENDAQIILWGPPTDIQTALETIEERCILAFHGVPNETRKALSDGTTIFERVLPGPNRMYPDTDSAPIPIEENMIEEIAAHLPLEVSACQEQLSKWDIPADTHNYLLKRNLFNLVKRIVTDFKQNPRFVGTLLGHRLKHLEGRGDHSNPFDYQKIYQLFNYIQKRKLEIEIVKKMLPVIYEHPNMDYDSILTTVNFKPLAEKDVFSHIKDLKKKFKDIRLSPSEPAETHWIMGQLEPLALGNIKLEKLRTVIEGGKK